MKELRCTPKKARKMMSRAGIRPQTEFGQKLLNIIEKAEGPEDEQKVDLTEREQAQMYLPFILSRLNDFPDEDIENLFVPEDLEVIQNWPEQRLSDQDYNDLVDAIQEFKEEMLTLIILDDEEANDVIKDATERVS